jgi:histidinol-phosphate aminotransferase
VVDEAYVDFGAESCLPLVKDYDNLLVTRTFSKSRSLAGARLGVGIAQPELIADLNAVRNSTNPYNVNRLTAAAGIACLKHDDYNKENCRKIIETRTWSERALKDLGFEMTTSRTNFLFARHPAISGEELYKELKKRGILIRHFKGERVRDYNRITVGTPEQMEQLVAAIKEILEARA